MKQKYPMLPRSIIKQQNGRYRDMKTLAWVSTKELERYAVRDEETALKSEELKHSTILSKRWDLNRD